MQVLWLCLSPIIGCSRDVELVTCRKGEPETLRNCFWKCTFPFLCSSTHHRDAYLIFHPVIVVVCALSFLISILVVTGSNIYQKGRSRDRNFVRFPRFLKANF
jgi:hypothetical protein